MTNLNLTAIDHLAFITHDLSRTIRFYRDLLGLRLTGGIGRDGVQHYFFALGDSHLAFFAYDGAAPMVRKAHGVTTTEPRGFDHVSFTVPSCHALFALKDRLSAADVDVVGPVDHGLVWSIYFFDPNGIALESSWRCAELLIDHVFDDAAPDSVALEGAAPRPEMWPAIVRPTPPEEWTAKTGNGQTLRDTLVARRAVRLSPELARGTAVGSR